MDQPFEADFSTLFPERKPLYPDDFGNFAGLGRCILVTGAGGSIGSALAQRIRGASRLRLILMDHSEQAISALRRKLNSCDRENQVKFVLGGVQDDQLIENLLAEERPDFIFHAAAFKHVPLLEENPFAAVENNGLATWRLGRAAKFASARLLLISTDKAANPRSMLGASKRLAELAILRWTSSRGRMSALRLGNVADSSGSVLPIFREQILRGGPVTVTHAEATRYFLTVPETCAAIATLASVQDASGLYLPAMGDPVLILKIAGRMIQAASKKNYTEISVKFTGLRPGDKLHEDLLSRQESVGAEVAPGLRAICGQKVDAESLDAQFQVIADVTRRRDLAALLEVLRKIVPEYLPGATLMKKRAAAAGVAGDD
jgi:FlaA1/EpsC-like NDP-sugar epimerase